MWLHSQRCCRRFVTRSVGSLFVQWFWLGEKRCGARPQEPNRLQVLPRIRLFVSDCRLHGRHGVIQHSLCGVEPAFAQSAEVLSQAAWTHIIVMYMHLQHCCLLKPGWRL